MPGTSISSARPQNPHILLYIFLPASLLSVCSTPEITTVDNRVEFMCVTAVSLLMQVFDGKDIPAQTMFTGNIISRATTHI